MRMKVGLALALGLFLLVALGLALAQAPNLEIAVSLAGRPADGQIKVLQGGKVVAVAYTDVHEVGLARLRLQPGSYTLLIDHGGDFTGEIVEREVTVPASGPVRLEVEVRKLFAPGSWGYYSADTHAHTKESPDGNTPVDQAVGVQLAADLDLVFISDHNSVKGHSLFARTAQERGVPAILSEEVTTDWGVINMGHFNVYSLSPGMLVNWRVPPAQIFREARQKGAKVVQVNHPKAGPYDYFNLMADPRWDPGFDVVEVWNGEFSPDDGLTEEQLFSFWNEGKRYTAVACSDDHMWDVLDVEYGRPRTYVYVEGELTVENWLEGLLSGHAFITFGPLIDLRANGTAIPGDTLTLGVGQPVRLEARIYSVTPLARAELLRNGEVLASSALAGPEATVSFEDTPGASGWYLLRVFAQDGDRAMTNPIWVEVK
ncbi:MAG: CehA/McbA family metallohydrolase [Candidatus Bipolaricaulia bacterium]